MKMNPKIKAKLKAALKTEELNETPAMEKAEKKGKKGKKC